MRVVFFSSNSNNYNSAAFENTIYPDLNELWQEFCSLHKEDRFYCVSQEPAMFMPDRNYIKIESPDSGLSTDLFVQKISELEPDLVIALSFWVTPYDWLAVQDAIIAEKLREKGIKVICHSKEAALLCFDKYQTMNFFEAKGFLHAPGIFVDHDLYFCAGNQVEVKHNVYKECILQQLRQAEYPLIIKNPVGLSSYGMTVVHSYSEAYGYLNSKKNNSSRLIEKYIDGQQFGTEIYGSDGNYTVMPPFSLSVNQYGITSPKLCQKTGPVKDGQYKLEQLKEELIRLAKELHLNGFAQVDLIWSSNSWYIIEINPRLSGMTTTYAAASGLNLYEYLYRAVTGQALPELKEVINKKIPLKDEQELKKLYQEKDVLFISQIKNLEALQERERGYCEVISRSIFREAFLQAFCTTRP
ncbi:MAG: ATP-grasp domain-containing protein [Treponema sp.]|nr:ATP-grasp domain-containing protein [Treponema sp.]